MKQKTFDPKKFTKSGTESVDGLALQEFGNRALQQLSLCDECDYGKFYVPQYVMLCHHRRKKGEVFKDLVRNRPCRCNTAPPYVIKKLYG